MAHIQDVAAYILTRLGPMTAMKLQKLCYYAYGYHLAWEGRMLFLEHFEAWANGPVAPYLYDKHRGRFQLAESDIDENPATLDDGERESIDIVLANLSHMTAHDLSDMTHNEHPWLNARQRAGAGPLDRTNEHISKEDIYFFFDALFQPMGRKPDKKVSGRHVQPTKGTAKPFVPSRAALPNAETIQVLPLSSGAHAATDGSFVILDFPADDDPSLVVLEAATDTLYLEQPDELHRYTEPCAGAGNRA